MVSLTLRTDKKEVLMVTLGLVLKSSNVLSGVALNSQSIERKHNFSEDVGSMGKQIKG